MAVRGDYWVKDIVTSPLWWEDCKSEYDYCLLIHNEESDVVNHMIGFMRGLALKTRSPKSVKGCLWPEGLSLEQQALLTLLEEDYKLLGRRGFASFWQVPEGLTQRVFAPASKPSAWRSI